MSRLRNRRPLEFERLGERSLPSTIFVSNTIIPPHSQMEIEVMARSEPGDPLVRGLNLRAQLGDGRGPGDEPVFAGVSYLDTIWSDYANQVIGGVIEDEPQFLQSTVVMTDQNDPSLVAEGVIARLMVDAREITSGTYEVRLSDTPFPDTDFALVPAEIMTGTIMIALPGDSNLDGVFNSSDIIHVLTRGEYEDNLPVNSDWSDGDWDGNGDFESGDFIYAIQAGHYVYS
jgi:hypothetical protein